MLELAKHLVTLFPLNNPSFPACVQIVVHQIDRQRTILRGDRVTYFPHAAFAIDEVNDLVSIEFGKILCR